MRTLLAWIVVGACLNGVVCAQSIFPLSTSADSRYLIDHKGMPFPILGRTAWFLSSVSRADVEMFVDQSVSLGYNAIEMSAIGHDLRANHSPLNGNNDAPFIKQLNGDGWNGALKYNDIRDQAPDMTTANEKYWKHLDWILSYCESRGVLVFLFPCYVGYANSPEGWLSEMVVNGSARMESYGGWVARRYKSQKNIVWMLLGDMGTFNNDQRSVEAALIKGLKSTAGASTHFSAEANSGQNSTDQVDFGNEMTLNGTYTWDSVGIASLGRNAYSHKPILPAFLLEEPYDEEGPDGNKVNPHATQPVRRFQWWGWLSTIGGYISGNGYVWPFVDPFWRNHLDTPGAHDMQILNAFIRSLTWWKLVPSGLDGTRELIMGGQGDQSHSDYVAAAAIVDGSLLVAYIPPVHSGVIRVNLGGMKEGVEASWFDPTGGNYSMIGTLAGLRSNEFRIPGKNSKGGSDWVLVIK